MGFSDKYIHALHSTDLRDDEFHYQTEALQASSWADKTGGGVFGSALARVKFADGTIHKDFESGSQNLAALLKLWCAEVAERGRSRGWVTIRGEWDILAAVTLYRRVAHASLAYWMDGRCEPCNGAGVMETRRTCTCCAGSGKAMIEAGRFESQKILDMISELEGIFQAHSGRASSLLRRVA
jgi:hypothetical protein